MRTALLLLASLVCSSALAGPNEALAAAVKDARTLPATAAPYARYLTTYALRDGEKREFVKALAFHLNSLSREADLAAIVQVDPELYRVDVRDYGWDAKVYERLADADPHFHVRLKSEVEVLEEFGNWYVEGRTVAKGTPGAVWRTTETRPAGRKVVTAAAPWLDAAAITELVNRTQSQAPLLRADWFFFQTAISEGHEPGYLDFLGVKNRKDFEQLVGLDAELSKRLQKEIRAIVDRSGVALNNRQIVRFQTITGGYWVTLDSEKSTDRNNAVRLLDGDYQHDAEEIYGVLPNGLLAVGAFNAAGVVQKTVPDKIASDGSASGNDRRIHTAKSCFCCHAEGIRPIDDYARRLYRAPVKLQAVDYDQFRRLQRLYLTDLAGRVRKDQADYAEVLARVNGLAPAENAKAYLRAWDAYVERDLATADIARELGVTAEALSGGLKKYAATAGQLDPVLAGLLQDLPLEIRREHFDEAVPLFFLALKGYVAP
jgi:hypothetical protein